MRTFGKDDPDFMEFKLGDSDTVYRLPLPGSMTADLLKKMAQARAIKNEEQRDAAAMEWEMAVLRRYLPDDVVAELTAEQVNEIFTALNEESEKRGASSGE